MPVRVVDGWHRTPYARWHFSHIFINSSLSRCALVANFTRIGERFVSLCKHLAAKRLPYACDAMKIDVSRRTTPFVAAVCFVVVASRLPKKTKQNTFSSTCVCVRLWSQLIIRLIGRIATLLADSPAVVRETGSLRFRATNYFAAATI